MYNGQPVLGVAIPHHTQSYSKKPRLAAKIVSFLDRSERRTISKFTQANIYGRKRPEIGSHKCQRRMIEQFLGMSRNMTTTWDKLHRIF